MSGRVITPGEFKRGNGGAPDAPPELSRDIAINLVDDDEATALEGLPPSQDCMAYTRVILIREVFAVLTASMPPTMHPEYELVTVWRRASAASEWRMHERWIRAPGGDVDPLARLDEHFNVLREA